MGLVRYTYSPITSCGETILTLFYSNPDNCLRAFSASPTLASSFCVTYTAQTITATTGIPAFLSNCGGSSSRLSSGCTCIATTTGPTTFVTATTTSSTTTSSSSSCPSVAPVTVTVSP